MLTRSLAVIAAAEGLIVSAIVGLGAEVFHAGSGILVFGLALYLPLFLGRVRR